jgi:DNA helicase-2/ATP-dependent DNA helicase PcrA
MTRARDFLYLTASRYRFLWGIPRVMRPSRFLEEIPAAYLHHFHARTPQRISYEREYTPEVEEEEGFREGAHVLHRDFGVGIVERTYKTSHGLTYDIFFPQASTRRSLVAKYAKLTPSSDPDS